MVFLARMEGLAASLPGTCDGHRSILPVSEWGDDEALDAAQILVHVAEVDVCDGHSHLVVVFLEVEARLLEPLKVRLMLHLLSHLQ